MLAYCCTVLTYPHHIPPQYPHIYHHTKHHNSLSHCIHRVFTLTIHKTTSHRRCITFTPQSGTLYHYTAPHLQGQTFSPRFSSVRQGKPQHELCLAPKLSDDMQYLRFLSQQERSWEGMCQYTRLHRVEVITKLELRAITATD